LYEPKSVRMAHTSDAEASMSMFERIGVTAGQYRRRCGASGRLFSMWRKVIRPLLRS
jgi:hypothetical protein